MTARKEDAAGHWARADNALLERMAEGLAGHETDWEVRASRRLAWFGGVGEVNG
jgi:hypothetical protein